MARGTHLIVVLTLGPLAAAPAAGQLAGDPPPKGLGASGGFDDLLFRQPPDQYFGLESDTEWRRNQTGQITSALTADNFALGIDATICGIVYYGFYGADANEPPPWIIDPPATETMRIQFYSDAGGLPGSVLWERTFDDATRAATGRNILVGPVRPEYKYTKGFADCFQAQAGTPYWISISQIGDAGSRWRWESSYSDNTHAQRFPIDNPWHLSGGYGMAFELHATPEPVSGVLLIVSAIVCRRATRRQTRR